MRRWFVALLLCGFASVAMADEFDLPTLRGSSPFVPASPTYTRWDGYYFGGQVGYSSNEFNFQSATESLISYVLRASSLENEQHPSQWHVLGSGHPGGGSYGGFAGYNAQWGDAVIGVDLHYNRGNFFADAPLSPITRVVSAGGNTYNVTISGSASMRITDFGSARLRAGWAMNNFMPYGTLGIAVGRANATRSAQVSGAENPPTGYPTVPCDPLAGCVAFNYSATDSRNAAFIYGYSAGLGVDVLLMPNFFVRAEYEYLQFAKIMGIEAKMNTVRVGAGIKF